MDTLALILVDPNCRVKYLSQQKRQDINFDRFIASGNVLCEEARALVQDAIARRKDLEDDMLPVSTLVGDYVIRVAPMVGCDGTLFILSIETDRSADSLSRAARRFKLTRRESDVLAEILEGSSASEIADSLGISEYTVQGYFKRLLSKTNARNRPAMVANVLEWDRPRAMRGRYHEDKRDALGDEVVTRTSRIERAAGT